MSAEFFSFFIFGDNEHESLGKQAQMLELFGALILIFVAADDDLTQKLVFRLR